MYKNTGKIIVNSAVAYMRENLTKKVRVEEIAAHCGVSPSWLEKTFAKVMEHGVMRHFLDLKLEYAARLLKEGYSVNYLSEYLQFSSAAHLSLAFKKKYGLSPLKYKYRKEA